LLSTIYAHFLAVNIIVKRIKDTKPRDLDKKKLRYIFNKILERIKKKPNGFFEFSKLRGASGYWVYGDYILLDHRDKLIPTIIHETLHDLYEGNNEKWIERVESKVVQILKPYDVFRLMNATLAKTVMDKPKKTK
jgi:hypothetical protein